MNKMSVITFSRECLSIKFRLVKYSGLEILIAPRSE
jgi:hypothetical protein